MIQFSNTIDRNTRLKVLKTLEDDVTSKSIAKKSLKAYTFDNPKMPKIPKIQDLQHTGEGFDLITLLDQTLPPELPIGKLTKLTVDNTTTHCNKSATKYAAIGR